MNDALGKYSALFIIPLLQANYILLAIINGGIFFDEFRAFKAGHWVVFALGLLGIFIGLYYLRPEVGDDHEVRTKPSKERSDELEVRYFATARSEAKSTKNIKNILN